MSKTTHKKVLKPKGATKGATKGAAKGVARDVSKKRSKSGAKTSAKPVAATKATAGGTRAPARKGAVKASRDAEAGKVTATRTTTRPAPARVAAAPNHGGGGLAVGSKVPAFRLPRDGGATVSLDSFAGRKLVLFFYPRAGTPGCTKEAMDFSRLSGKFAALDTAIVGVSADPPRAQETFRDKHDLTVPLLSDPTHEILESFGVWGDKSLYGKVLQGIIRTTVLVGPDARVIHVWRHVKVDGHAEAVLRHIENL
ncbi:MAG: peroxiredoxin [Xanthobacteraceae bacterium]|nr:peroxiredoxin [Xanthobacteraceae bacterium]